MLRLMWRKKTRSQTGLSAIGSEKQAWPGGGKPVPRQVLKLSRREHGSQHLMMMMIGNPMRKLCKARFWFRFSMLRYPRGFNRFVPPRICGYVTVSSQEVPGAWVTDGVDTLHNICIKVGASLHPCDAARCRMSMSMRGSCVKRKAVGPFGPRNGTVNWTAAPFVRQHNRPGRQYGPDGLQHLSTY